MQVEHTAAPRRVGLMTDDEIRENLVSILSKITELSLETVRATPNLRDLANWDSLSLIEFILETAEVFSFEIEPKELRNCFAFEDLVQVMRVHQESPTVSCTPS